MKLSVCLSSYDRAPAVLDAVLASIFRQKPEFEFEVIVVDDGTPRTTTREVCGRYPTKYIRIERPPIRRNPCVARNVAYRAARGDILVLQSDDVIHVSQNTLQVLAAELEKRPSSFVIATVYACGPDGKPWSVYTGVQRKLPYFFLGSMWRSDLYAVGGNDESFIDTPGYDDEWFAQCIQKGLGLTAHYTPSAVAHHLYHPSSVSERQANINRAVGARLAKECQRTGVWCAVSGPWECDSHGTNNLERQFTSTYLQRSWSNGESASGEGSSVVATRSISKAIPAVLRMVGAASMLDIPCGDYCWMSQVELNGVAHTGADLVRSMVHDNRVKYPAVRFLHLDLLKDHLPRAEVVMCRDCLGHMSLEDGKKALANIKRSGAKYLLTTTFFSHQNNRDIETGPGWAPRCLITRPFWLPPPRLTIDELCREVYPKFRDKGLSLWPIEQL